MWNVPFKSVKYDQYPADMFRFQLSDKNTRTHNTKETNAPKEKRKRAEEEQWNWRMHSDSTLEADDTIRSGAGMG